MASMLLYNQMCVPVPVYAVYILPGVIWCSVHVANLSVVKKNVALSLPFIYGSMFVVYVSTIVLGLLPFALPCNIVNSNVSRCCCCCMGMCQPGSLGLQWE